LCYCKIGNCPLPAARSLSSPPRCCCCSSSLSLSTEREVQLWSNRKKVPTKQQPHQLAAAHKRQLLGSSRLRGLGGVWCGGPSDLYGHPRRGGWSTQQRGSPLLVRLHVAGLPFDILIFLDFKEAQYKEEATKRALACSG
ncbi:unnamed protein product, partial [Ectocarpus fasciculatus]